MKFSISNLERRLKILADDTLHDEWQHSGEDLKVFAEKNREKINSLIRQEEGD